MREWGVVPREVLRSESGIDFLRGLRDGRHPVPPLVHLLGMAITEVDDGRVVFTGEPRAEHYNPFGTVHGGFAATILDSCLGCAVHSKLEAGRGFTTLELKVNLVRALTDQVGPVRAEGRILHFGRQTATAEGDLRDAAGRLYAHASTTCMLFAL